MEPFLSLLADLIRGALEKSECVGLFAIVIILIVVMHAQNTRRLDSIRRELRDHTNHCPY